MVQQHKETDGEERGTTTTSRRMAITCAILQYDPAIAESNSTINSVSRTVFPVVFQVPSTAEYMTCSTTKVSVDSVRWPNTRFTAPQRPTLPLLNLLKGSDCMEDGTCSTIDAAIWVAPLCGDGTENDACLETFTQAACYPFCLAVRQSNSYNSIMRLYNALNWLDRVHLFNRDCAFHLYRDGNDAQAQGMLAQAQAILLPSTAPGIDDAIRQGLLALEAASNYGALAQQVASTVRTVSTNVAQRAVQLQPQDIETVLPIDFIHSSFVNRDAAIDATTCVHHEFSRSTIPKAAMMQDLQDNTGDYGEADFRSTLVPGQPFVYAGDTALVGDCTPGLTVNGVPNDLSNDPDNPIQCLVKVYRIYGTDANQMTLVRRVPHCYLRP